MNNNTESLKLVSLNTFDIDRNHTTINADKSTSDIIVDLYLNPTIRNCSYCNSAHTNNARITKFIYNQVLSNHNCIVHL